MTTIVASEPQHKPPRPARDPIVTSPGMAHISECIAAFLQELEADR